MGNFSFTLIFVFMLASQFVLAQSQTFLIKPVKQMISVNGILSEWEGVDSLAITAPFSTPNNKHEAIVKALWDWEKLYFAFRVTDASLQAIETENSMNIWTDDGIEIYLSVNPQYHISDTMTKRVSIYDAYFWTQHDFHFIVNINGCVFTSKGKNWNDISFKWIDSIRGYTNNSQDTLWFPDLLTGIKLENKGYAIELAINWSSLNYAPKPKDTLSGDLCVIDRFSLIRSVQTDIQSVKGTYYVRDVFRYFDWCNLSSTRIGYFQPSKWKPIVLLGTPSKRKPLTIPSQPQRKNFSMWLWLLSPITIVVFVFILIIRKKQTKEGQKNIIPKTHIQEIASKAIDIINSEYHRDLRTHDVAYNLFISERYLQHILKKEKGKKFREILNEVRIEKAIKLLETTNLSFTEIAMQVGYEDLSYFSNVFKKYKGIAPLNYKKKTRGSL